MQKPGFRIGSMRRYKSIGSTFSPRYDQSLHRALLAIHSCTALNFDVEYQYEDAMKTFSPVVPAKIQLEIALNVMYCLSVERTDVRPNVTHRF